MNELQHQVRIAHRRLLVQQFFTILPWTLSAAMLIAAVGVLVPKLKPVPVLQPVWTWSWLAGGLVVGLIAAVAMTCFRRRDALQAAIEIDQRFGLKERVSSVLALTPDEQQTQAGQALLADAMRRVTKIDVREQFSVRPTRWTWVPAACGLLAFGLTLLSDAKPDPSSAQASASVVAAKKRVQNSTESLKKRLEERRKQALEKGLKDAGDAIEKLEQGLDSLAKRENVDRQKALVKLNDLAKEIQQKKEQMGDREEIQKQLSSLKDIKQGPADRMGKAIKDGDFKAAINELKQLQDQLEKGEMTSEQKEKLQQQMSDMKDKLQQLANAHEEAKREMQRQIDQKVAQGDREGAAKLQQKLDQMSRQDNQMKKMDEIAQKLGQCSQAMKQGQSQQAAAQMNDLASSLEEMQSEMEEMEMLEDAMDQLSQAKDSMNCSKCNGAGCSMCQGMGSMSMMGGEGKGEGKGRGMGEGRGEGDRPESETDTNFYESQVRSEMGRGRAVVAGSAEGPNKAGQALEEIKAEMVAGQKSEEDPLTGQRLPKPQRQLTREYFDAFREGK